MKAVPETWREAALAFALDLAEEGENFPKRVLSLLDKHFGFGRSIFFPHHTLSGRRGSALSHYITYGISYGPMYDYKDHVHRDDLFRVNRLPQHLRGQRVVFTDDILPFPDFERSPFGVHMMAVDMYYQACLYLYDGGRVIASLVLVRSNREHAFDEGDRALLEYLCTLIEARYRNFLQHSGDSRFLETFQLFFQDTKLGAILLNQDFTVLEANDTAMSLSSLFWEQYGSNQSNFLRSNYRGEEAYRDIQTMVNEVSEKLSTQTRGGFGHGTLTLSSAGGDLTFYHSSFLSLTTTGAIQTWHILCIGSREKSLPQNAGHPYSTLTQQERRIAYFLTQGMKNEQIAQELHISIYTVRTHIANIYKKFDVGNKVDLLMCLQPYLQEQDKA